MNIDLECGECGHQLEGVWSYPHPASDPVLKILPCETCLDKRAEEATDAGRKDGYNEGYDKGTEDAAKE
jgi:hypothetical protein